MLKIFVYSLFLFIILLIYYLINIGNKYVPKERQIKLNKRKIIVLLGVFILFYILNYLLQNYTVVYDVLFTLIISIILAYLITPIVNYLEKYNMNKGTGVLFIYFVILILILIISFVIIPNVSKEVKSLVKLLPNYLEKISLFIDNIYIKYYESLDSMPSILVGINEIIINNIEILEDTINFKIFNFIEGIIFTFSKIISLVLIPILTFYFIKDQDYFKEKFFSMIPVKYRTDTKKLIIEIDKALGHFIRGRLILALYVGIATTIMLFLFKIEFALIIGMITGVADIIPYLGPLLGFLPAIFFAFLHSPIKAVWVGSIFLLIQWVENNILAPKIIGESIGMHPITILLALVVGGGIFGVLGMILSIPFIVIVKILYNFSKFKINSFFNRE